ncbi:MAG: TonB-dependent receptor [Bacteroidetes bacterium]|nr:TonB-dependent receptor [Bacteroidota bacterium]
MSKILFALAFLILITPKLFSQEIKGKVLDASNSQPLIGAIVKVTEDKSGAETDLDGSYTVQLSKAGTYTVEFSYVGYKTYSVKGVVVKKGEVTKLDATMNAEGVSTEEIVVEATTSMANENTLLQQQKNSNKISDGISEQQIKRAPDAAASDVLKRVIGVSIVKDKFVYVRGTSDRYNNTTLNGVLIPSTEPDKKAFSFDIFPSNLIENIIISKSFTADQPGNYTGGLVQITTKEFPESFTYGFNVNSSITSQTTGKDFYNYDAGQSKFLFFNMGSDDGGRSIPSSFPVQTMSRQNFTPDELQSFGRSLRNNWTQNTTSAPLNAGFQFSIGNNMKFLNNPLGYLAAFTYKNSFSNKTIDKDDYNTDNTTLSSYGGRSSEYTVLDGGILNLNYKLGTNHKISSKNTYSQSSENQTEYYSGLYIPENVERHLYTTAFTERYLFSSQLIGSHYLHDLGRLEFNWTASYSESKRNQPDIKTMTYQRDIGTTDDFFAPILTNVPSSPAGGRFFSKLYDIARGINLDFELPIKIGKSIDSRLKFGTLANGTTRFFNARNFAPALSSGASFLLNYEGIDTIFKAENISPTGYYYSELTRESDNYSATENLYAGYLMYELPLKKLRIITGLRFESDQQNLFTLGRISQPISVSNKNNDFLPSINLSYSINETTNLRASATQTVSRPELREIAPFSYTDFVSGITTVGNSTDLDRSLNQNYDLRLEMFPQAGEIMAVSLFYKHMNSPIEEVFLSTSTNRIKTFQNATDGARNYGVEFEVRKNLGFIHKLLNYVSMNVNLSLIDSKVNLAGLGSTATSQERTLQGQSPYTVNVGLFYDNYDLGTSVNLMYNKFGDRIAEVGLNGFNDIKEKGKDLVDLTVTQRLFKKFELKLAFKDLLNKDDLLIQRVNDEDKVVKRVNSGNSQSLTLSYKF